MLRNTGEISLRKIVYLAALLISILMAPKKHLKCYHHFNMWLSAPLLPFQYLLLVFAVRAAVSVIVNWNSFPGWEF